MYTAKHWIRIIVFTTALTFIQAFVFNTILDLIFADTRWLLVMLISVAIAVFSAYIYYVARDISNTRMDAIYRLVGLWWGLLFNLFIGSLAYWVILMFFGSALIASIGLFGSIWLFALGLDKAQNIDIKRLDLSFKNLADQWQGKKLAFVSDLHLGKMLGSDFLQKIVDTLNNEEIECLLIGGDLFDSAHADWDTILRPFKDLKVKDNVYYVTGNHEYHINYETNLRHHLEALNFNLLESNTVDLNGLTISGISHSLSSMAFDFEEEFSQLNLMPNKVNILLYHSPTPSHSKYALNNLINLQLSGHTHFGQLAPYNILTWLYYGHFDYGLYVHDKNGIYQYTSSGVGSWGPPVRTTAKPEVVIITLKKMEPHE